MGNIVWHQASVTREKRNQQNQHGSAVVWFTGLSGSGKSTLSHALEEALFKQGCQTFVLDGDNVRHGLSSDLGFSEVDREENVRRTAEVAKLMTEAGLIILSAFISPLSTDRQIAKDLLGNDFIEVYCSANLQTCESRDVKGLYKKARAGLIKGYTGIDAPYEPPIDPAIVIDTAVETIDESIDKLLTLLRSRQIID